MKELRDDRSERAARHDDRAFCAERSPGSDRDCRRQRLQNRQPRLHLASINKDRFQGFRNPVPANPLRAVSRHNADDKSASHRHQNREPAQMISRRRRESGTHLSEVKEVGEEADEPQQRPCDTCCQQTNRNRQKGNRDHARRRREIAQLHRIVFVMVFHCAVALRL